MAEGKLIIVSGPSGAGKTSVLKEVLRRSDRPLVESVSATTRAPREGEEPGRDYFFLSPEDFEKRREAGDFLESAEYSGNWYATPREEVTTGLAAGNWVVLEIELQGTRAVREQFPDAIAVFVRPSSVAVIEQRLRDRGTETEDAIRRRLEVAQRELQAADEYSHQVINDDIDQAVADFCRILEEANSH